MRVVDEVRKALDYLGLGRQMQPVVFYELWFWGFLSAAAGGFLWGLVWQGSIGGDFQEPHGPWAALWPVVTMIPGFAALSFLNGKYRLQPWPEHATSLAAWTVGAVLGAVAFYDLPLADHRGFRELLLARSPAYAELWLVLLWSTLVSLPAFLCMAGFRWLRLRQAITLDGVWFAVVKPVGLVVIVTSLPVVGFLLAYPDRLKFEQARGIVAALFLRIMLFVGLFIALQVATDRPAERPHSRGGEHLAL